MAIPARDEGVHGPCVNSLPVQTDAALQRNRHPIVGTRGASQLSYDSGAIR